MRRLRYLAAGWLWYLVTLVPVIGLVQVGQQAMADRYTYVPLIGLFAALSWGIADAAGSRAWARRALPAVGVAVLAALATGTWVQTGYWKDSASLMRRAVEVTENNFTAHNNLGNALADAGKMDDAIDEFRETIRINPAFARGHINLGLALAQKNDFSGAIREYSTAISISPNIFEAHYNLGNIFKLQNHYAEAAEHYRIAIGLNPDYARARDDYGFVLAQLGMLDEAERQFSEAVTLDPSSSAAHSHLGIVYAKQRRLKEAVEQFAEAVRLQPDSVEARLNLAQGLVDSGDWREARRQLRLAEKSGAKAPPDLVEAIDRARYRSRGRTHGAAKDQ